METLKENDNKANLDKAFTVAETEFGVPRLLDPEGIYYFSCVSNTVDCG